MTNKKLHQDLPTLSEQLRELVKEDGSMPPVDSWEPEREGEIDIRIDIHGKWHYQGEEMVRMPVVRLLSSILKQEGDGYCLVTPAEKMHITVEDVPFVVPMLDIEGEGEGQKLHMTNQVGDCFTVSKDHPISFKKNEFGDWVPYVKVRSNLLARLNRSVYYELADLVVEKTGSNDGEEVFGVWSSGDFFPFSVD